MHTHKFMTTHKYVYAHIHVHYTSGECLVSQLMQLPETLLKRRATLVGWVKNTLGMGELQLTHWSFYAVKLMQTQVDICVSGLSVITYTEFLMLCSAGCFQAQDKRIVVDQHTDLIHCILVAYKLKNFLQTDLPFPQTASLPTQSNELWKLQNLHNLIQNKQILPVR